jgi:hypothetical protein
MQQSHFLGMTQQQLVSMQQQGLAGVPAASAELQLSHSLLQQQLALGQMTSGTVPTLLQADAQQQGWLGFLQQPVATQQG